MTKKFIYLDYAASTPMDPQAERILHEYSKKYFANPSSLYASGRDARKVMEVSRSAIARILGAKNEELIFTGSGTEANNLAIMGIAYAYQNKGKHLITTAIEHHSVLRVFQYLESQGFEVSYLNVKKNGLIDPLELENALRKDTILVSIGYANNEIGTIQPIKQIAKIIFEHRKKYASILPALHTDACQAAGLLDLKVKNLGVDLMTLNSSKVYGPKGIGLLFKRRAFALVPLLRGGDQEHGLRPGTENVALIASFTKALEISQSKAAAESARLIKLRDFALAHILENIPAARLNGDQISRLANNLNISLAGNDGEMLVHLLNQRGICVATGSACTATSTEPSHVLKALGLPNALARTSLRITLGRDTTKKDLSIFIKELLSIVKK